MKNVVIRAPLLTASGYGVHSRQIFKWLDSREDFKVSTQCVPWGHTSWIVNPDFENGLIKRIMDCSNPDTDFKYDISFQVQLPDEWDINLAKFNVGVSAAVETDRCNPDWVTAANRMDLVIVPSQHARLSLVNTGEINTPIVVVPESYHEEIDASGSSAIDLNIDTNFNFLVVGQLTGDRPENDRKNLYCTLKWMCEAFKDDPDVGIILKTNNGKNTKIDRELTTRNIKVLINEVRSGEFPKIHLLHGYLSPSEISSLYIDKKVSCLVTLTRGEGYGLPILEAAASGLPIIATNWSGHLDFLRHGKFIPVHYRLKEIPDNRVDDRIFIKGAQWAEPIESDFKKKVLKFRHNYEKPRIWAEKLMLSVKENFSFKSICEKYDQVIEKIDGGPSWNH